VTDGDDNVHNFPHPVESHGDRVGTENTDPLTGSPGQSLTPEEHAEVQEHMAEQLLGWQRRIERATTKYLIAKENYETALKEPYHHLAPTRVSDGRARLARADLEKILAAQGLPNRLHPEDMEDPNDT
jgi:hypothetical protein